MKAALLLPRPAPPRLPSASGRGRLGASFADHYRTLRLERARNLLMQSTLPITEVALACGFANASHFSRAYSAKFGIPPRRDRVRAGRMASPLEHSDQGQV